MGHPKMTSEAGLNFRMQESMEALIKHQGGVGLSGECRITDCFTIEILYQMEMTIWGLILQGKKRSII